MKPTTLTNFGRFLLIILEAEVRCSKVYTSSTNGSDEVLVLFGTKSRTLRQEQTRDNKKLSFRSRQVSGH